MRVCVLTQAIPSTWSAYYVSAFRECCDTLVAGPPLSEEVLRSLGRTKPATPEINIEWDIGQGMAGLYQAFPRGWTPDLVVGISDLGGNSSYPGIECLTCPTAFLTIDTWQCLLDFREALKYDVVFSAQREFVGHLQATGSREVHWLPLACDPKAHYPLAKPAAYDIAFAGSIQHPVHRERRRLLQSLQDRFSVICPESAYGEALCAVFAEGRLAFNHCAVQEVNMRIFESLAMGRPLLTNHEAAYNGLLELFEDEKHLIVYRSEEDLIAKTERYLRDTAAREAIAAAGRAEALEKHTYVHRVQRLLEIMVQRTANKAPQRAENAYRGDHLHHYLPTYPGEVVDFGLVLESSRIALRRHGVTRLTGIPSSLEEAARRHGSYDALEPLLSFEDGIADTAVVDPSVHLGLSTDELLWQAHRLLKPGGTLVMRMSAAILGEARLKPESSLLGPWLASRDFLLRHAVPSEHHGGCMLQARKRTRPLAQVVSEVFTRLCVPEIDVPDLVRRIPADW